LKGKRPPVRTRLATSWTPGHRSKRWIREEDERQLVQFYSKPGLRERTDRRRDVSLVFLDVLCIDPVYFDVPRVFLCTTVFESSRSLAILLVEIMIGTWHLDTPLGELKIVDFFIFS
jgi:hypothetical protein